MRFTWFTAAGVVVVLGAAVVSYYARWRRGDDIRIPGVGVVRRFPCGDYEIPPSVYGTTQAFAIIDGAALAARSNERNAVKTLVDAVFDRELPGVRCGNPLRRRIIEAEWQFRTGLKTPITEQTLADVANEVTKSAQAPPWARTTVEELHFLRTVLRDELPRFIGVRDSGRELSEKMSPVEALFVIITLGRAMVLEPDDFRDGPEAYVSHVRKRQLTPSPSGAVLRGRVMMQATVSLVNGDGFEDQHTLAATSAQRFLDQLGFPK